MTVPADSFHPLTRADWRAWLQANHTRGRGIWVITYKKASGKAEVGYDDLVEEALCFGWVDSKGNKLDDERTMLWMAPRKPGSGWARSNKERIERLIALGQMAPSGLAVIEAAKADGSWSKLDTVETLTVPPDLESALAAHPPAAEYFAAFPRSVRRAILEWINAAKRPETRARRVEETAVQAAQNIRANQWRQ